MKTIWFLLSFIILTSCGCATWSAVTIEDLNNPLVDLQKIAGESLPLGKRKISQNQRTYSSDYFTVKKGEFVAANEAAVRHYAEVVILGDRRPYTLEISVINEKRDANGDYYEVGTDKALARVLSRRIQNALYKRRDGLNIIDDFRVF